MRRIKAERRDGQGIICAVDKSGLNILVYENLEQKMTSIHYILYILCVGNNICTCILIGIIMIISYFTARQLCIPTPILLNENIIEPSGVCEHQIWVTVRPRLRMEKTADLLLYAVL